MQRRIIASIQAITLLAVAVSAQEVQLLSRVQSAPAAALAWNQQEMAAQATIARTEFVRVNTDALLQVPTDGVQPLATFGVQLFGRAYILDIERNETVLGYRCLTGKIRGREGDSILVVAPGGTISYSTLHMVEDSFVIAHAAAADVHVVQELDERKNKKTCGCCAPGGKAKFSPSLPSAGALPTRSGKRASGGGSNAGPGPTALDTLLDVAVFYTQPAMAGAGSKASIEAAIVAAIARTNATSVNASTPVDFRLVHMSDVNYSQDGTNDLSRFRSTNDGYMDGVHAKRNTYGADLMHLITNYSATYCGVAYLMNNNSTSFASNAFGVTVRGCMGGNVVSHEIGHNIACHHDRANAGRALFPHAYGFRTPDTLFRTVMSYSPGNRIDTWSSPAVKYKTYTMGTSIEDNNLTITKTRAAVSGFRSTKVLPFRRIGGGIPGVKGNPRFTGSGILTSATEPPKITLWNYRNNTNGVFVIGLSPIKLPFLGGILIPKLDVVIPITGNGSPIVIDASGLKNVSYSSLWVQALYLDAAAVQGVSATSGFRIIL